MVGSQARADALKLSISVSIIGVINPRRLAFCEEYINNINSGDNFSVNPVGAETWKTRKNSGRTTRMFWFISWRVRRVKTLLPPYLCAAVSKRAGSSSGAENSIIDFWFIRIGEGGIVGKGGCSSSGGASSS